MEVVVVAVMVMVEVALPLVAVAVTVTEAVEKVLAVEVVVSVPVLSVLVKLVVVLWAQKMRSPVWPRHDLSHVCAAAHVGQNVVWHISSITGSSQVGRQFSYAQQ